MKETRKTAIAAIIENRTGVTDYSGPLSHLGEAHAAEFGFKYGLVTGLYRSNPTVATGAATLAGISTVRKVAETGIPSYAKRNALLVMATFVIGLLIGALTGPYLPEIA